MVRAKGDWSRILESPPKSGEELLDVLKIGEPPPGLVTSTLLACWGVLDKPLKDSHFVRDEPFLRVVIGFGERREMVLDHLAHHSPEAWKFCLEKLQFQSARAKQMKASLSKAGMPSIAKQMLGAMYDLSVAIAEAADRIDTKMREIPFCSC